MLKGQLSLEFSARIHLTIRGAESMCPLIRWPGTRATPVVQFQAGSQLMPGGLGCSRLFQPDKGQCVRVVPKLIPDYHARSAGSINLVPDSMIN